MPLRLAVCPKCVCVHELKYLTIQLLCCKEAVLSVVNSGINSGLSKQLLYYLYFYQTFVLPVGSGLLLGSSGEVDTVSP